MISSSDSPLLWIVWAKRDCSGERFVSSSSSVMPITPFMGVRISWLMVARNSPLALAAVQASAAKRLALEDDSLSAAMVSSSCFSASLRAVTSLTMTCKVARPRNWILLLEMSTFRNEPSARRWMNSNRPPKSSRITTIIPLSSAKLMVLIWSMFIEVIWV